MNDLVKAVLNHNYAGLGMKKQVYIYKRSRNKRIKDKSFVKLLTTFTKEKPVARIGDLVLIEIDTYRAIEGHLKELEEKLARI